MSDNFPKPKKNKRPQSQSPLGRASVYPETYQPELLHPIARAQNRQSLGINAHLPFHGVDIWTAYELSWLNSAGIPQVAVAEFSIPCASTCMVESKSLKLYLNSLNQATFESAEVLTQTIAQDLSRCCEAQVGVGVFSLDDYAARGLDSFVGECVDRSLDGFGCEIPPEPSPELLRAELLQVEAGGSEVSECLYSDLFKSNCPVTGQPDWASIAIAYRGQPISRSGLLAYIISFRHHQDFHEHCVERIFIDIQQRLSPAELTVYARYTRRGGLDINPYRSSHARHVSSFLKGSGRLVRQ